MPETTVTTAGLTEEQEKLRVMSAVKIQSAFKGHRERHGPLREGQLGPSNTRDKEKSALGVLKERDKAARVIQKAFREYKKEPTEEERDAATAFQRVWRGRMVRKSEDGQKVKAGIEDLERTRAEAAAAAALERERAQKELLTKFDSDDKHKEAVVTLQAFTRGMLARGRVKAMRQRKDAEDAAALEVARKASLDAKIPELSRDEAARRIQTWWKSRIIENRAKANAGDRSRALDLPPAPTPAPAPVLPESDEAAAKRIVEGLIGKRKDGWPKYIERNQLRKELVETSPLLVYDERAKAFVPRPAGTKSSQGIWIDGIAGNYNGGLHNGQYFRIQPVEHEIPAVLNADGTVKTPARKETRYEKVDSKGRPISADDKDRYILGDDGRAMAYASDVILIGAEGVPVAQYESAVALQRDVDAIRAKHQRATRQDGKPYMAVGETKVAFAMYRDKKYNRKRELVGEIEEYALIIETHQGVTQVMVNKDLMAAKMAEADKEFNSDDNYRTLMTAALLALKDMPDEPARIIAAEKMVRQQIREQVMTQIVKEVKEAQQQSAAVRAFSQRDLVELALSQGYGSTGVGENLAKRITKTFDRIPSATSNYVDHKGVAISKNGRGADVVFNGGVPNDQMYINIPGTSYYARAACAPHAGTFPYYVNGVDVGKECKGGETWIDENSIFYNDGAGYTPLRLHGTNTVFGKDPTSLQGHFMAEFQGGPKGYKGIQKYYDNFSIKVSAQIAETRSVAVKIKEGGKSLVVSAVLKSVAFQDKNNEQLVFVKHLPTAAEIASGNFQDPWETKDLYAKHPVVTTIDGVGDNDARTTAALAKIAAALGGSVFSRVRFVGEAESRGKEYARGGEWLPIASDSGTFYRDKAMYKLNAAGDGYVEVTRQDIEDALQDSRNPPDLKLTPKELATFSGRYMVTIEYMEIRNFAVRDEFKQIEEELRAHAVAGDVVRLSALTARYAELNAAIDAKYPHLTVEQRAAAGKDMSFDINAVDPRSGQTALHIAASRGHKEAVDALLAAGANPALKDRQGHTAAELGRKKGHFDSNNRDNLVSGIENEAKRLKQAKPQKQLAELTRNARVLKAKVVSLQDELASLKRDARLYVENAATRNAESAIGNNDPVLKAAAETATKAAKDAQAAVDSKGKELAAAEAASKAADKKLKEAKQPKKVKERDLVPSAPRAYETLYHPIKVPKEGAPGEFKYVEVAYHRAKQDCVVPYHDGATLRNKSLNADEVVFDENFVRFYHDPNTADFAEKPLLAKKPLLKKPLFTKANVLTPTPEGFTDNEWRAAADAYRAFAAKSHSDKLADVENPDVAGIAVPPAPAALPAEEVVREVADHGFFSDEEVPERGRPAARDGLPHTVVRPNPARSVPLDAAAERVPVYNPATGEIGGVGKHARGVAADRAARADAPGPIVAL